MVFAWLAPRWARRRRTSVRRSCAGLGLLGLSAPALLAGCSSERSAPEGAECGSPQNSAATAELVWAEPIEVARGPARQGPWRMNDSEFEYVDDPAVAVDDGGRVAVAWADQERQDIFLSIYDTTGAETLAAPVNVSRTPDTFSWLPRAAIAVGDPNMVYVLWQEIIFSGGSHGGEILFARSTDGGRSFEPPVNLSESTAGDGKGRLSTESWDNGSLDLVLGAGDEIHVAWTEYEGALWYQRSTDGGQAFAEPLRVAGGGTAPARGPSLAAAGDEVHLAWTIGEDPEADVHLVTSTDGGRTFGVPNVVGNSAAHADAPKLAMDGEGTIHLVYADAEDGRGGRYEIHYTRRPLGTDAFEAPRVISRSDVGGVDAVAFPSLSIDGDGNLYVVWERFPTAGDRALGLCFARSEDGGRTFGWHGVVPGTADAELGFNGSLQGLLMRKLAVAGDGAIAVVNSSYREGEVSLVRLMRGRFEPAGAADGRGAAEARLGDARRSQQRGRGLSVS